MFDHKKIIREVRKMKCKEHNQHPDVTMFGRKIKVSACCEKFKNEVVQRIADDDADQIVDAITGSIN
jgi:hypothetical protein